MLFKTYGGKNESPGKTRVRAQNYEFCGRRLWDEVHIVIASEDCGDIRFLLDHGVAAERIIACDINPAARSAAAKFGVVVSPQPRIEATVIWAATTGYRIGSINVDLCETMLTCAPIMAEIYSTVKKLGIKCVLMYTFQRGRDRCVLDAYPNMSPDDAREAYLTAKGLPAPYAKDDYVSYTGDSKGSTMGVYAWYIEGKRGPKSVSNIELPNSTIDIASIPWRERPKDKKYKCSLCQKMMAHPIPHRKDCKAQQVQV